MSVTISRRAAIGAALLAPPAAMASKIGATISSPFMAKLRACERAYEAEQLFCDTVHAAAHDRWRAAVAALPVPVVRYTDVRGAVHERRADDHAAVERARTNLETIGSSPRGVVGQFWQELVDASHEMHDERARLADVTGYTDAVEKMDQLSEALWAAVDAVVEHPVDNAGDLAAKLRIVSLHQQFGMETVQELLAADLDRIAAAGGLASSTTCRIAAIGIAPTMIIGC
jgi:hypothetical protein